MRTAGWPGRANSVRRFLPRPPWASRATGWWFYGRLQNAKTRRRRPQAGAPIEAGVAGDGRRENHMTLSSRRALPRLRAEGDREGGAGFRGERSMFKRLFLTVMVVAG